MLYRLTDATIRATAAPAKGAIKLADGGGLYLLIGATGRPGWRYRYRLAGKQKHVSLGPWPDTSIADAREAAKVAAKAVREGRSPATERRAAREAAQVATMQTFGVVGAAFLEWERGTLKKRTADKHAWLYELLAPIHRHPVADVTPPMLLRVIEGIAATGKPEAARRACQFATRVFKYAVQRELGGLKVNPARELAGAVLVPQTAGHPGIVEPARFGFLMRCVDEGEMGFASTRHGLQLIARTALRAGELRLGLWSEIDWEKAEWRIPAPRMKMNREHLVPLSRQALEILRRQQAVTGHGQLIFTGIRSGRAISDATMGTALKAAGFAADEHVPHGFRKSFSTLLNENGFDSALVELQLSHAKRDKIAGIYDKSQRVAERRAMMQAWSDMIDEMKTLKSSTPSVASMLNEDLA